MPKIEQPASEVLPIESRVYRDLGLDLTWRPGEKNATTDCPFCGEEVHFGIDVNTSQYQCWKCKATGNRFTFIRELINRSDNATTDYADIVAERGLLFPDSAIAWRLCRSEISGEWLIPGYSADGKIMQVYRYIAMGSKKRAIACSGLGSKLVGLAEWDPKKPIVDIVEGFGDGLILREMLSSTKEENGKLSPTANKAASLFALRNVVAMPGCTTPMEEYLGLMADKTVYLWAQNDHDRVSKNGTAIPSPSYSSTKKLAGLLMSSKTPPLEIKYLYWGDSGFDSSLPHGYDVKDAITSAGGTIAKRIPALDELASRMRDVPDDWLTSGGKSTKGDRPEDLKLIYTTEWTVLVAAWKRALCWTEGLDVALSSMLATIVSTTLVGDQLWMEIISPPSTGKSVLCEAVSTNRKHVLAKSTIRGFHSGFGDGSEDNSLLSKLANKTLVTKDGDTLLQSPNLGQILAEGRDVYDKVSRTHYRNKNSRNYEGVRTTWLLCGTSSLLSLDESELGERFLKCIIMDGVDDALEDEILMTSAVSESSAMKRQSGTDASSQEAEDKIEAKARTGGYIDYLCDNVEDLMSLLTVDSEILRSLTRYGKFIAFMRARPSTRQSEHAEREMAARLVKQIVRFAQTTAIVLNKTKIDHEVMRRVRWVTLNTSRGVTLSIADYLRANPDGCQPQAIAAELHKPVDEVRKLLRFMRQIGMIETYKPENDPAKAPARFRLTSTVMKLYNDVVGG